MRGLTLEPVNSARRSPLHGGARQTRVFLVLVLCVAASLRLYRVSDWPVFMDEDDYTQIALDMTHLAFPKILSHPFSVGKPPLVFLVQAGLTHVDDDPLLSGRLVSVAAGLATTALVYGLGQRLGGHTTGLIGAALYATAPLAVLHERMVLQDGPATAATLCVVMLAWVAVERGSRGLTALGALVGIAGVAIRVSAVLVVVPVLLLVLVVPRARERWQILGILALTPLLSYLALRLSPVGSALAATEGEHWFPLQAVSINTSELGDSALTYLGIPVLTVLILGAAILGASSTDRRKVAFLVSSTVVWVVPWVFISNFAPSRYYLPGLPFICLLAGLAIARAGVLLARYGVPDFAVLAGLVLAIGWAGQSWRSASDLSSAGLSQLDDVQYRSGAPSGYGYREAADYVRKAAAPGATIAYAVDPLHYYAVALQDPPQDGVRVLGLIPPAQALPPAAGAIYVIVDDARGAPVGQRAQQVQASNPRVPFEEAATFNQLHSPSGVHVLLGRPE